jgi:hypothetical protein
MQVRVLAGKPRIQESRQDTAKHLVAAAHILEAAARIPLHTRAPVVKAPSICRKPSPPMGSTTSRMPLTSRSGEAPKLCARNLTRHAPHGISHECLHPCAFLFLCVSTWRGPVHVRRRRVPVAVNDR